MKNLSSALLAALCAAGCLENEELLEIEPSGAARIEIRAQGQPRDLADGYPVPFGGPWRPANDAAVRWLGEIAPDTGGALAEERARSLGDDDLALASQARFARVEDVPRTFAPATEPYASAFLERRTRLDVRAVGPRTVYALERTYSPRTFRALDAWSELEHELPPELLERLTKVEPLAPEDWEQLAPLAQREVRASTEAFARAALSGVYERGDAALRLADFEAALASVRAAVEPLISRENLMRTWDAVLAADAAGTVIDPACDLDAQVRDALRGALESSLGRSSVAPATRNAVRERLEWGFTDFAHTQDLGDEKFVVRVRMPGSIVDGNFDALEDGAAVWRFEGADLRDRARSLRALSVLE